MEEKTHKTETFNYKTSFAGTKNDIQEFKFEF